MVRLRQGQRFQTGRKEPAGDSRRGTAAAEYDSGRHIEFQRSTRLRNKHVRSRSLIVLMVLLALVLAAIAMLA